MCAPVSLVLPKIWGEFTIVGLLALVGVERGRVNGSVGSLTSQLSGQTVSTTWKWDWLVSCRMDHGYTNTKSSFEFYNKSFEY